MHHDSITLDGVWEFLHVADDRLTGPAEVRQIEVPSPWQAQFHDLRMRAGIGIYRRSVDIPPEWLRDTIWIRFGAVFHNSRVFINDQLVGSNEGGFLPFSFDVTEHLLPGTNEIKVRVDSPTDNPAEFPDSPFAEIPFGKQSWYGPLSGIWQSVYPGTPHRRPHDAHQARAEPRDGSGDGVAVLRGSDRRGRRDPVRDPRSVRQNRSGAIAGGATWHHRHAVRIPCRGRRCPGRPRNPTAITFGSR